MKKMGSIIAVLLGLLLIFVGINTMNMDEATAASTTSFGADFYTYQHNTTVKAVNNLDDIYNLLADSIGWLFIFLGGTDIAFAFILGAENKKEKNPMTVTSVSNADVTKINNIE